MIMDSKQDYVKYRLKKSEEALLAADLLIDHEMWNAAINRLYYASFYAVSALLYLNDIEVKSHKSVRIQFFKEFVKPGKFQSRMGNYFLTYSTGVKQAIMAICPIFQKRM